MAANTARKRKQTAGPGRSAGASRRSKAKAGSGRPVRQVRDRRPVRDSYEEPIGDEIRLIVMLALSALLLLSVLGFAGSIGGRIAQFLFGFFGLPAYAVPILLFVGSAFLISNRGSFLAKVKIAALCGMIWAVCSITAVLGQELLQISSLTDGFRHCAASCTGGGLLGYLLTLPVYRAFGEAGALLIFISLLVIFGILLTGRRVLRAIGLFFAESGRELGARMEDYRIRRQEERALQMEEEEEPDDTYEDEEDEAYEREIPVRSSRKKTRPRKASRMFPDELEEDWEEDTPSEPVRKAKAKSAGREKKAARTGRDQDVRPVSREPVPEGRPAPSIRLKAYRTGSDTGPDRVHPAAGPAQRGAAGQAADSPIRVPEFLKGGRIQESVISRPEEEKGPLWQDPEPETDVSAEPSSELSSPDEESSSADKSSTPARKKKADPAPRPQEETLLPEGLQDTAPAGRAPYRFPPLSLLISGDGPSKMRTQSLRQTAVKLQETFESFGVGVTVTDASIGPSVTRYELTPDTGVKVSRIVNLADDIKLNLAVPDIRIEAPIPGKAAVGIEVPNDKKEMVRLRDLLESEAAGKMKSRIAFAAGKDIGGQTIMANIEKMPHLLIAGATGSGKSVCINTIIMSVLYRADPEEVKMIMVDPKVVELTVYNGLPHLLIPVVTDPKKAAGALNWAVQAMMDRYNLFKEVGTKNIKGYNEKVSRMQAQGLEADKYKKLPQILIIIDELADLMQVARSEVEDAICRLAQLARAAGIHLVIATQRPSVDVITGLIKANVPSRIAFAVSSAVDSRTILDMGGAEKLLGDGDMLFHPQGTRPVRVQGAFVSEEEIASVVDFIKEQFDGETGSNEEILKNIDEASAGITGSYSAASSENDRDMYFEDAGRQIIEKEKASIGMLQRMFKIGFNRAARIMDQLAAAGVVGPEIGTKPREIRMTMEEFEHYLATH